MYLISVYLSETRAWLSTVIIQLLGIVGVLYLGRDLRCSHTSLHSDIAKGQMPSADTVGGWGKQSVCVPMYVCASVCEKVCMSVCVCE